MSEYVPRLTTESPTPMEGNEWWYSDENPFYATENHKYGLPNCTCYAYGRYAEIMGKFYALPTGNAGLWYNNAKTFTRGSEPALGAIACWYDPKGTYSGHVGVVEQIFSNGNFMCSYSGYGGPYFNVKEIEKSDSYRFTRGNGFKYTCQGFIYGYSTPEDAEDPGDSLPDTEWHCKATDGYSRTSAYAKDNAIALYKQMRGYGWSLSAICGLLGNIEAECSYNPWQWESNKILASDSSAINNSRTNGYGLVQWTPPGQYLRDEPTTQRPEFAPNYSDKVGKTSDAVAQLWAIENRTTPQGQWIQKENYRVTWAEYKANDNSPEWSAECFVTDYERPGTDPSTGLFWHWQRRREAARYWYEYFIGYTPSDPDPPPEDEPPLPDPTPIPTPTPSGKKSKKIPADWYAKRKGQFKRESDQAYNNVCCIFNKLFFDEGWTVRAICGMLGNVEVESGYNPYYWSDDFARAAFTLEIHDTGVKEVYNRDLDVTHSSGKYGLLQWNPSGLFLHNKHTESWWKVNEGTYFEWKTLTVAWANFCNPIYITWYYFGWHYLITGWEYTAAEDANIGKIQDGEEQLKFMLKEPLWDPEAEISFDSFIKSNSSVIQTAKQFRTFYCNKGINEDGEKDRYEQAIDAAKYWYKVFKKYEKTGFKIYGRRRQILA